MIMMSRERSGLIFFYTTVLLWASDYDCCPFHYYHYHDGLVGAFVSPRHYSFASTAPYASFNIYDTRYHEAF